jgi:O-antigen chain-terminating methyltransferase
MAVFHRQGQTTVERFAQAIAELRDQNRSLSQTSAHYEAQVQLTDVTQIRLDTLTADILRLRQDVNQTLLSHPAIESMVRDLANAVTTIEWLKSQLEAETHARETLGSALESVKQQRLPYVESTVRTAEKFMHGTNARLGIQERRISVLLEEARRRQPAPFDESQLRKLSSEPDAVIDPLYLQFEDIFRGTRSDIKDRLSVYIDRIREIGLGTHSRPILDLGCGRGEWLELLRDHGLLASGVDANLNMVEQCQKLALSVQCADALEFLRTLPSESLGAVTGFHIVEHLRFPSLLALLDETVRVLKSDGLAIFETPNPENILVSTHTFYLDPTHQHPLPPDFLRFLVEARGLCGVEILRLHPYPESCHIDPLNPLANFLNYHFYGPQDYAVIGKRV